MAFLSIYDTITRKSILPGLADLVFVNDPLLAYIKANCLEDLPGLNFQEDFIYDGLPPVWFGDNPSFNMSQKQVENGLSFTARKAGVPVSASLDKLNIDYYGEEAVFDYIDVRMQVGAKSLSGLLAVALYQHGQNNGTDRSLKLNGLAESLSDGTTNGWLGQTYTTYGTVARSSVNSALNSPMTGPAASVAASISYPTMEQAYNSVVVGSEEPNLIVTTNSGMSYIKMAFQAQQRFEGTGTTQFGFRGISFNNATILQSQYAPGQTAPPLATLLEYTTPSSGETIWFLNVKREHMKFYLSPTDLFGFGFTGWKPAQDNLTVGGQYLFAGNFTNKGAKYSRYLFAVTG